MQREELKKILRPVVKNEGKRYIVDLIHEIQAEHILRLFGLENGNVVKYNNTLGVVFAEADTLHWFKLKKDNKLYQCSSYLCSSYGVGRIEKVASSYEEYLKTLNR